LDARARTAGAAARNGRARSPDRVARHPRSRAGDRLLRSNHHDERWKGNIAQTRIVGVALQIPRFTMAIPTPQEMTLDAIRSVPLFASLDDEAAVNLRNL